MEAEMQTMRSAFTEGRLVDLTEGELEVCRWIEAGYRIVTEELRFWLGVLEDRGYVGRDRRCQPILTDEGLVAFARAGGVV